MPNYKTGCSQGMMQTRFNVLIIEFDSQSCEIAQRREVAPSFT